MVGVVHGATALSQEPLAQMASLGTEDIDGWVQAELSARGFKARLVRLGAFPARPAPALQWRVALHGDMIDASSLPRQRSFRVLLSSLDEPARHIELRIAAMPYVTTWVISKDVLAGQAVSCAAMQMIERAVSAPSSDWITSCDQLANLVAKRPLLKGSVLSANDFHEPPLVMAQAPLQVISQAGSVQVRSSGLALGSARAGDVVSVQLPGRRELVRAVAVGPSQVVLLD